MSLYCSGDFDKILGMDNKLVSEYNSQKGK